MGVKKNHLIHPSFMNLYSPFDPVHPLFDLRRKEKKERNLEIMKKTNFFPAPFPIVPYLKKSYAIDERLNSLIVTQPEKQVEISRVTCGVIVLK